MTKKIVGRCYLHGCHVPYLKDKSPGDAVIISELLYYEDGTTAPNLRIIKNPNRTFYITKPMFRNQHTEKKERELISNCDVYVAPNYNYVEKAHQVLFGYTPKHQFGARKKVMESPYIYNGATDIVSLIKIKYLDDFAATGLVPSAGTTGTFDTEISLVEGSVGELLAVTLTHENNVFTVVNSKWMYKKVNGQRVPASMEELQKLSKDTLDPIINGLFSSHKTLRKFKDKLPFKFTFHACDHELDMIKWVFQKFHENQTTFVGIWNLGFDIKQVLRILEKYDVDPADIFNHPSVPENMRFYKFREDTKRTSHIADKWHWNSAPAIGQFVDSMAIYNRVRVVAGKETSYALDAILKKNNITGKLDFDNIDERLQASHGTQDWHRQMSLEYFLEYVVYNQWDSISMQCMEWVNTDLLSVYMGSDNTNISQYPRQTVKNQDTLIRDWKPRGYVIGTPSSDMVEDYDEEIEAEGGAVLDTFGVDRTGMRAIREYKSLVTQIHVFVSDVDFSQMYPTIMECANIAKETRLTTAFYITGDHVKVTPEMSVEVFYSCLVCLQDNVYDIGTKFLNTPTYEELDELYANAA